MIKLSMIDANDFVQTAILDGNTYKLRFSWNSYSQCWLLDVRTNTNVDIVRGISVVANFPLLKQHKRNGLPRGEIMAVVINDKEKSNQTIGRKDFINGKFSFVYVPEVELNAIMEATV